MKTEIELDTRILNKNLEITKLTSRIDSLTSDLIHDKAREVFKPYMIRVLQEVHELVVYTAKSEEEQGIYTGKSDKEAVNSLLKDLRKVIRFMKHKKDES